MDTQSNIILQNKNEQLNQTVNPSPTAKIDTSLKQFERSGNIVWALFLIFLGIIFLFNNIGLIPWGVWSYLWRFWPLLLIIGGIQAILGSSFIARILVGGLTVVLFVGLFLTALAVSNETLLSKWGITIPEWWKNISQSIGNRQESKHEISKNDFTLAENISLKMDIGVGQFEITDDSSDQIITIDSIYYERYGEPQITEKVDDKNLTVQFTQTKHVTFGLNLGGPEYSINFGQNKLSTDLELTLGAGSGEVNLTDLNVNTLLAEVGAGSLSVNLTKDCLPAQATMIKVGTGEVIVSIPSGVGYKLNYQVGVGSVAIDDEKINKGISDNQIYTSENYTKANLKLEINVDVGVGSFKLITK